MNDKAENITNILHRIALNGSMAGDVRRLAREQADKITAARRSQKKPERSLNSYQNLYGMDEGSDRYREDCEYHTQQYVARVRMAVADAERLLEAWGL